MRAWVLVAPVVFVGIVQMSGCANPQAGAPAPPGGIYRSESAGALFEQSVALADPAEGQPAHIAGLALRDAHRPSFDPDTVYVAASDQGYAVSRDDGRTWQVVAVPLASVLDVAALEGNIVVVTGIDGEGQGYILRSGDSGKSWQTVLTVPVPARTRGFQAIRLGTEGEVASVVISIAPDPFNPNRLYAGTSLGNVFVGEQFAKTWRAIHNVDTDPFASNQAKFSVANVVPSPHRLNEMLVITAAGRLYYVDAADKQTEIKIPQHLGQGPILGLGQTKLVLDATFISQFPDAILVGVNDGAVLSRDRGATWEQLPLPVDTVKRFNTLLVRVSPTNPNRIFVVINDAIYRSEDGGASWNTFSLSLAAHVIINLLINPENPASVMAVTTPLRS